MASRQDHALRPMLFVLSTDPRTDTYELRDETGVLSEPERVALLKELTDRHAELCRCDGRIVTLVVRPRLAPSPLRLMVRVFHGLGTRARAPAIVLETVLPGQGPSADPRAWAIEFLREVEGLVGGPDVHQASRWTGLKYALDVLRQGVLEDRSNLGLTLLIDHFAQVALRLREEGDLEGGLYELAVEAIECQGRANDRGHDRARSQLR